MDFSGKITHKTNKETVGEKQTPKQSIRVEEVTDSEHKNAMFIDFFWKSQPLLDVINVWDIVTVWVNIKCSEYKGRWYTNIGWWKIEKTGVSVSTDHTNWDLPF